MTNSLIIVGRIFNEPVLNPIAKEFGNKNHTQIIVAVNRLYKNAEGVYETDLIPVTIWNGVAENVCEWSKKGDLIGIRGRLEENEGNVEIIADRVSFLASKKEGEEDGNNK